jgi:DNA-binding XRE family transcriptional regulator
VQISSPKGHPRFWQKRGGLELASAHLLPDRREVEVRFRFGQAYRIRLAALGLDAPAVLASPGRSAETLVLFHGDGQAEEFPTSRLLAIAEPEYRDQVADLQAVDEPVGTRIRRLRKLAGRTAVEVAHAAGMSPGNFARLEADRHDPRLATLRRVAEALGTTVRDLL